MSKFKIAVLGGAGDMGFSIVKNLTKFEDIEEVSIGDIKVEEAERKIKEEKLEDKVKVFKLDVKNESEAINFLKKYDAVASAIGPFYEYAAKVMSLAIKAGVNFLDICDDYDGAEQSLNLNEEAKKAGVTCITGLGWTPGLSNILARLGYEEFGKCDAIRIYWVGSAADSKGFAVVMHVFHALTGEVPQFLEGQWKMVKAGSEREIVEFPNPFKQTPTYYTGHPEPITIPKFLEGLKEVKLKGALVPDWQNKLAMFFVKLGLTKTPNRKRNLAKFIHSIEDVFRSGGIEASGLRVDILKGDEVKTYAAVDRMGNLTGIPAAIGSVYLAKKGLKFGVFAPEGLIDPSQFLEDAKKLGLKILEKKGEEFVELR